MEGIATIAINVDMVVDIIIIIILSIIVHY